MTVFNMVIIINLYEDFSNIHELENFFKFENDSQCFYFAFSYYLARVAFEKHEKQFKSNINSECFCKEIVKYLKETKNKLNKLIELNIEPTLKSFIDWEKITEVDKMLQSGNFINISDRSFITQFKNRKIIINNLIKLVEQNINVVQEYIDKYLPTNVKGWEAVLEVEKEDDLVKSLGLSDEYKNDVKDYLADAGLIHTFKYIIKKKVMKRNFINFFLYLGFYIFFSFLSIIRPLITKGSYESISKTIKGILAKYFTLEYSEENYSIFSVIKSKIFSFFSTKEKDIKKENEQNQNNIYIENKGEYMKDDEKLLTIDELEKFEKNTIENIKKYIKDVFNENKKNIFEEIKFLLFIDYYFYQQNWTELIKKIINNYFEQNKKLKDKTQLIKLCDNKESHELAVEKLKNIIKESITQIINIIKEKFESDEYEENEIKTLEHIIIKDCGGDLDEKSASDIVAQILSQKVIDVYGNFNKNLFNEMTTPYGIETNRGDKTRNKKDKNLNEKPKEQSIKIYYNTPYPQNFNKIDNINQLSLSLQFVEAKDPILQDVLLLYMMRNYKSHNKLIQKDFTQKIIDILNRLYNLSLLDFNEIAEKFYNDMSQKVEDIIENYLNNEIFVNIHTKKDNKKINQLNKEEQEIYDLISQNSGKKAIDLLESRDFFKQK